MSATTHLGDPSHAGDTGRTREDAWQSLDAVVRPEDPQPEGWYAVALASEVPENAPVGVPYMGGRLVVYRGERGELVALDARCPHMGADLALGEVVGDDVLCAYHHFRFGPDGRCRAVPSDGPVPSAARVRSYEAVEHYGLVWVWHGDVPTFPPPEIRDHSETDVVYSARRTNLFEVAPWLSIGNTFDFLHLRYVHGLDFDVSPEDVRYVDAFHIELEIPFVSAETGPFEQRIRVTGTNAVSFQTITDHTTLGLFTSTPIGTQSQSFYVAAVPRDPALTDDALAARVAEQEQFGDDLLVDDARTLAGIRFQVGTLVAEDRAMKTYMQWVSRFPTSPPPA